jgi:phage terminase small subunit
VSETPAAPKHLRPETRAWWRDVVEAYELEGHHLKLLTLAAESWDRSRQAREALKRNGLTFRDRFGAPRARPEIAVERDAKIAFARLVRELRLDLEEPGESRPPAIHGRAGLRRIS